MNHKTSQPHRYIPELSRILFQSLKTPLIVFFTLGGNAIMFSCAYFFYIVEKASNPAVSNYWDSLWWALCTVSTVGYGDIVPHTTYGRLIAAFLIIVGVGFFLGFMAVLVSTMSSQILEEENRSSSQ